MKKSIVSSAKKSTKSMALQKNHGNIVWMDMEMTGKDEIEFKVNWKSC